MGKRSRKRAQQGPGHREPTSRAQRDAARAQRSADAGRPGRPQRPGERSRPPAPWGKFPLSELVVLLALVMLGWGFFTYESNRGKLMIGLGLALGAIVGLELSVREHFAGYRSHTTLLAGAAGLAVAVAVGVAGAPQVASLAALVLAFVGSFWALRAAFQRRSGGLSFR
jgi:hypothetical protein